MVINPQNGIHSANTGNTRDKTATSGVTPRSDSSRPQAGKTQNQGQENVFLSQKAQSLNRLEAKIKAASDVDTDRVAAIKRAIDQGSYRIHPDRIAERMLQQDDLL